MKLNCLSDSDEFYFIYSFTFNRNRLPPTNIITYPSVVRKQLEISTYLYIVSIPFSEQSLLL